MKVKFKVNKKENCTIVLKNVFGRTLNRNNSSLNFIKTLKMQRSLIKTNDLENEGQSQGRRKNNCDINYK